MKFTISFIFAFFCGAAANAQVVRVPGTIQPVNPGTIVGGAPTTHLVDDLHFGLDIPIPIPTLPGVPVYDLPNIDVTLSPAVQSPAVAVAQTGKGLIAQAAHPAGLQRLPAVTTARTRQDGQAIGGFIRKAGEKLGLLSKDKKLDESRLRAVFDGSKDAEEEDSAPVWTDNSAPSRPHTLPEDDLLREIGVY